MLAIPSSVSPWSNEAILLYHGTDDVSANSIIGNGIDLARSSGEADFGRGFYTTTGQDIAYSWAWQRCLFRPCAQPAIVSFSVDRDALAELATLWFVRVQADSDDYWKFVVHCWRGGDHGRNSGGSWYDVVVGPMAATPVLLRSALPNTDQVSFHTETAIGLLNLSTPAILR